MDDPETATRADLDAEFERRVQEVTEEYAVQEIPGARVAELVGEGAPLVVLDVRSRAEYAVSTIPGAVHVGKGADRTLGEALGELGLKADDDRTVVMFCAAGYKSARSIASLPPKLGSRVFNIRGGAIAYANAGGRLILPGAGEDIDAVHGYDEDWSRFVHPPTRAIV